MNVLFITLGRTIRIDEHGIYSDLMRKFHKEGHNLFIVYPLERRERRPTSLVNEGRIQYLGVHTLNLQKTNIVEKGLGTLLVESQYKHAINKYFKGVSFDLILYSTPPITFPHLVRALKLRFPRAISYLMLKDIFPQNAVDLGMFGQKSLFYSFFRVQEKDLYAVSDYIGCMSPANVNYLIQNNPQLDPSRIEVCPNSIEIMDGELGTIDKQAVLDKYGIPIDKPIILYGGNLGKPQGIEFLVKALSANSRRTDCHFLIVGDGTEYHKIKSWIDTSHPSNVSLIKYLPGQEYNRIARVCDIGLICLDYRFTIPNFPSRVLSYLENRMPVIVTTDPNSDLGPIAQKNGFGYWCKSNDIDAFTKCVDLVLSQDYKSMGEKGFLYLMEHYLVDNAYGTIMKHFRKNV